MQDRLRDILARINRHALAADDNQPAREVQTPAGKPVHHT